MNMYVLVSFIQVNISYLYYRNLRSSWELSQVEVETNRGKRSIICGGFWYKVDGILKSDVVSWRCSVKDCTARIRTDSSAQTVFMQKNQHSHEPDERKDV
jgi:hypothetical protein